MPRLSHVVLTLSAALAVPMAFAIAGAQVDESRIASILVVDATNQSASDANPGTQSLPFKTIAHAAQVAMANSSAGVATKILVGPGIYRESLSLAGGNGTATIVLQASQPRGTVISGSDIWTGWSSSGGGVYVHQWPYQWGLAPYPAGWAGSVTLADIVRRREMIFVNSVPLTQVLDCGSVPPGSFCVSEAASVVYINPPAGVNLNSATVEVGVRSILLSVFARQNIVVRGIVFRHDVSALEAGSALQVSNSSNVLIDNCAFLSNNYAGLSLSNDSALTVNNSEADNNGIIGIAGWQMSQTVIETSEANNNNWRGLLGGFTDWEPCGMKLVAVRSTTLNQFQANRNSARGLWFDTDDAGVTITGAVIQNNLLDGLFFEAVQGPIQVDASTITGNLGNGVVSGNAEGITLSNSTIWNNAIGQVMISGVPGGRSMQPYNSPAVTLISAGWTLHNDVIGATSGSQPALLGTSLPQADWNSFVQTLASDGNTWYQPNPATAFQIAGGATLSLPQWTATTGLDQTSTSSSPTQFAITPSDAAVSSGNSLPFTPLVAKTPASRVTYSLAPALGTISPQGVYSAPRSFQNGATVYVTAVNPASPSLTATASVTLSQAPRNAFLRLNVGGPSYTDVQGQAWAADTGANFSWNNNAGLQGNVYATTAPITGTSNPAIYQTQRWAPGTLSYSVALPNGQYTVVLHFAELVFTAPGQRVFSIALNGVTEVVNFDPILRSGGRNIAADVAINVTVVNGMLTVTFLPVVDDPVINALEIIPGF
jgi:hypothetical protein